jgi:hypothetical protein
MWWRVGLKVREVCAVLNHEKPLLPHRAIKRNSVASEKMFDLRAQPNKTESSNRRDVRA